MPCTMGNQFILIAFLRCNLQGPWFCKYSNSSVVMRVLISWAYSSLKWYHRVTRRQTGRESQILSFWLPRKLPKYYDSLLRLTYLGISAPNIAWQQFQMISSPPAWFWWSLVPIPARFLRLFEICWARARLTSFVVGQWFGDWVVWWWTLFLGSSPVRLKPLKKCSCSNLIGYRLKMFNRLSTFIKAS